jgi:hypothetical protein
MDMDLATITSAQQTDAVCDVAGAATAANFWVGATDAGEEGNWKWVNSWPWAYTRWGPNQPDDCCSSNAPHQEDCLMIWCNPSEPTEHKSWNDAGCSLQYGFICAAKLPAGKQLLV